jgi:hypothetical protein
MSKGEIRAGGPSQTGGADSEHPYFSHMIVMAAEDKFDPDTSAHCRTEAAEYLVDSGLSETPAEAAVTVWEQEAAVREGLSSGQT